MFTFAVEGMSCAHCIRAITNAVHNADPQAQVEVDLARKRVDIDSGSQPAGRYAEAISEAGYQVVNKSDGSERHGSD